MHGRLPIGGIDGMGLSAEEAVAAQKEGFVRMMELLVDDLTKLNEAMARLPLKLVEFAEAAGKSVEGLSPEERDEVWGAICLEEIDDE